MANPQLENGYTKIANELLEAFARTNLSSYQFRIVSAILRKTYGWNKKEDWVSISQLIELTGIHKSHVCRAKKELIERRIVTYGGNSLKGKVTKGGNKISLNKDHTQWRELPKGATTHHKVTEGGNLELPKGGHTKETITKEKRIYSRQNPKVTPLGNNCPHQKIQELYHQILPELPKIVIWDKQRQAALRARWKENPSLDWWKCYFEKVSKSSFLLGKKTEWKASIDFLLRPSNKGMTGVLEGKYDDKNDIPDDMITGEL